MRNNFMYNILPFIIAKRELSQNGIESTPPALLFGLMPGMKVPMLQQVILNKAVVDEEVAVKQKNEAVVDKVETDLKMAALSKIITELRADGNQADLLVKINKMRELIGLEPLPAASGKVAGSGAGSGAGAAGTGAGKEAGSSEGTSSSTASASNGNKNKSTA